MNLEIPDGLSDMLRDFTVAVLRERPTALYDFAVDYFTEERARRKPKPIPMYIIVDSDEEAGEPDRDHFKPKSCKNQRYARRHSVSAERYDPEADSGDEEAVVYPKTDEQRKRLTEAVSGILLFRSLDLEQMKEVIDAMFEKRVNPGDHVIYQGEDGDNFYVIETGVYDVFVKNDSAEQRKVYEFDSKGSFGELALMYNQPRSATVTATKPGTLWAMDRKSFRRIVLKSAHRKRKMYETLLNTVPLLQNLDPYERMNLADALTPRKFESGECIIAEGQHADGMYFIEDGNVRVTINRKDDSEEQVAEATQGGYFGEMALVENQPRSASVYALNEVKVAFLERDSFERLLGPCLDVMKRNIKTYKY